MVMEEASMETPKHFSVDNGRRPGLGLALGKGTRIGRSTCGVGGEKRRSSR